MFFSRGVLFRELPQHKNSTIPHQMQGLDGKRVRNFNAGGVIGVFFAKCLPWRRRGAVRRESSSVGGRGGGRCFSRGVLRRRLVSPFLFFGAARISRENACSTADVTSYNAGGALLCAPRGGALVRWVHLSVTWLVSLARGCVAGRVCRWCYVVPRGFIPAQSMVGFYVKRAV